MNKILLKTIIWRIIASVLTIGCAYIVTGNINTSITISGSELIIKTIVHYCFEKYLEEKR